MVAWVYLCFRLVFGVVLILHFRFPVTFKLRQLILFLAFSAVVIALVSSFYLTYQVQKEQLINYTLKNNSAYANKLASATNNFLKSALQQLAYSAKVIEADLDNNALLNAESQRLHLQTNSFNSVVINKNGITVATSPHLPKVLGVASSSEGAQQALVKQQPLISHPYVSPEGNFIIFITSPFFDKNGKYVGYIGGTLYLKESNILSELLEQHYYSGGSYIYVVDANKRLIYHPDSKRIGEQVNNNAVINAVINGSSGKVLIQNSQNINMLAGYAPVEIANWGIVAQRPLKDTLAFLDVLGMEVIKRTAPLIIIILLVIAYLAHFISKPLRLLADSSHILDDENNVNNLKKIRPWYFEAQQIKIAMLEGVSLLQLQMGQLRQDALTDPLTGAHNRRGLNVLLERLINKHTPFAVLEIDIDFFKRVNDTYGHDVGDKVLKLLTEIIQHVSRKGDIVARTGGEEFLLILPHEDSNNAFNIAERLRKTVATTAMPQVGCINISIGIALWPVHGESVELVFKCADRALYSAKKTGRNKTVVASECGL